MTYFDDEKNALAYKKERASINAIDLLPILLTYIPPASHLLELGIGSGVDFAHISKKYRVLGTDLSHVFVRWARTEFPDAEIVQCSADDFTFSQRFSGIYSNKVLYNFDPQVLTTSFQVQSEHLGEGGIGVHTIWQGSGVEYHHGEACYYYTPESLMESAGEYFSLVETREYAEFSKNDSLCVVLKKKPY